MSGMNQTEQYFVELVRTAELALTEAAAPYQHEAAAATAKLRKAMEATKDHARIVDTAAKELKSIRSAQSTARTNTRAAKHLKQAVEAARSERRRARTTLAARIQDVEAAFAELTAALSPYQDVIDRAKSARMLLAYFQSERSSFERDVQAEYRQDRLNEEHFR